jgi:hypothetical protein
VNLSRLLSWSLPSPMGPYPALLPIPLDPSLRRASLCKWPKSRSSALSSPDCSLVHQQGIHPSVPLVHVSDEELLLSSGKLDGPVMHLRLSGFPVLRPSCLASGRCIHDGCLLRNSLRGQNPQ